jgi:osmoprotectant transport system substrate-binding protein
MKRIYAASAALAAVALLAACGSSGSSGSSGAPSSSAGSSSARSSSGGGSGGALPSAPGSVTIGSAAFPESALLADIYGDAMAAKGVKVSKKLNIGERGVYIAALKDGSIGAVPEYTGSILAYLDNAATAKSPTDVYAALQQKAAANGFAVGNYSPAQDSDTITVTKSTADKYKLTQIGDLKSVASKLTLGAPAQFKTRADGVPALKSVYGVVFGRFKSTQAGGTVTVNALKNGSIDAADIFSTDPSIIKNGFVSLKDPKSMFAAQNVVPLFAQKVLTQPMKDAVDAVSAKLDTKTLAGLVGQVSGGKDPDAVAKAWLSSNGLG